MHSSDRQTCAIDYTLELHQATGIDRDHRAGLRFPDGIDLGARHRARDFRKLDRERAAESAAFFRRIHFAQGQAPEPWLAAAAVRP